MERIPTATEVPYSPASEDVPLSAPIDTAPYGTLYGVGPKPVTVYGYVDPTGGVAFVDSISVFGTRNSTVSRTRSPNPPEVHRQTVKLVRSELRGPTRVSLPGRCPRSVEGDRRPMNHRGPPGAEPVGTLAPFPSDAARARTSVLDAKRRQSRPRISTLIPSHATAASNPTSRVHPFAHLIPSIPYSIPLRRAQSAFQPLLRSPSPQARRWTRQWHGETSHDPTSQRNAHS